MRRYWAFAADAAVVAAFVALGRDTHEAPLSVVATIGVAAPFLLALAAMWMTPLVRLEPWRIVPGAVAGAGTAVIGLVLRTLVFSDGVSGAFPAVTLGFLTVGMAAVRGGIGWRRGRLAVE